MTRTFHEVVLPAQARLYVEECLRQGNTLSGRLLQHVDQYTGDVRTFVPSATTVDKLLDFHHGGVLPVPPEPQWQHAQGSVLVPISNTDSCLAEVIEEFLGLAPGQICIFEDALAKVSDGNLSEYTSRIITFEDEVYHVLTPGEANRTRILQTIGEAKSIPTFIGVLTSVSNHPTNLFAQTRALTWNELASLADRTEQIIVGAYDGESYLLWDIRKPALS